jgi:dephospho-CoA kinase
MLYVGLAGYGPRHPVGRRLTELGAVPGQLSAPPAWEVADPSIFIFSDSALLDDAGASFWPGLHLVIATSTIPAADVILDGAPKQIDELWPDRLVPFEANLRTGRRAPRQQHAVLADPDPTWPAQAGRLIKRLRFGVGQTAADRQIIRVDHIGSTSVPGLPAKQLIDIQVVVADLAAARQVAVAARRAGFVHVPGQWFGTDRHGTEHAEEVIVNADPGRPVNINIRPAGAPIWRETLLLRDWLRLHNAERDAYAATKHTLSQQPGQHVDDYSVHKMPWISAALGRAEDWAASTGWSP